MSLDHKDEYTTLRQEMLERFERIHDTTKYGVMGFIAFLTYYWKEEDFNHTFALLVLQGLVLLMGFSALHLYQSIYRIGTYIAIKIEKGSEAKWHRMSRQYSQYLKETSKDTWKNKMNLQWPFPLGGRWGADSTLSAWLILSLIFTGYFAVWLKLQSYCQVFSTVYGSFPLILLNFLNLFLCYKLSFGMENYRKETEQKWLNYIKDFGTEKFKDPYE